MFKVRKNSLHSKRATSLGSPFRRVGRGLAMAGVLLIAAGCQPATTQTAAQTQDLGSALETAAELLDSIKCIVPAPSWYKKLWVDLNGEENALGRAFMTRYMSCAGGTYRLTADEFRTLPVAIVPQEFGTFYLQREFIQNAIANRIGSAGDVIADIDETILASTHYGNTLGHFQLELRGKLVWRKNEFDAIVPHFKGEARVKDRYDFNPSESSQKDSWRGNDTELRVRIAHFGMPGRAFDIESDWLAFNFDYPRFDSDLIQESKNNEKSGYSSYGEQVQLILMTELRSARWEKASAKEKLNILVQTMKRLHAAVRERG
jgi:hypothetical protein